MEEERAVTLEKLQKARINEKSLLEKCETLHEEIKSLKWKHDQNLRYVSPSFYYRNLNLENEELKHKLKMVSEDKDKLVHEQRMQFEEIIKKVDSF